MAASNEGQCVDMATPFPEYPPGVSEFWMMRLHYSLFNEMTKHILSEWSIS